MVASRAACYSPRKTDCPDVYLSKAKDSQSEEFGEAVDEYMSGLTVVGIVGLMDPLKPDIKHTVRYASFFLVVFAQISSQRLS